jgi:hypothetical protein
MNAVLQPSEPEEFGGLSPNARLLWVCPDMLGRWRLFKSLALDDARWAIKLGRKDVAAQYVQCARGHHREIMRIKRFLRTGARPPYQPEMSVAAIVPRQADIPLRLTHEDFAVEMPAAPVPEIQKDAPATAPIAFDKLPMRQRQVLLNLVAGKSDQQIAADTGLSAASVQVYRCVGLKNLGIARGPTRERIKALKSCAALQGWAA